MARRPLKSATHQDPPALRAAMKGAGLTQAALARALGISPSHMCEIANGTRNAKPARLRKIARLLGCDPRTLERRNP
jgi:transcriptional regulator with XRE-family HTH domain